MFYIQLNDVSYGDVSAYFNNLTLFQAKERVIEMREREIKNKSENTFRIIKRGEDE